MRQPKPIAIPEESRRHATAALRAYLDDHFEEDVGELKAALLLDFVLTEIAPSVYNQAIADARGFLEERTADLAATYHREEFPSAARRRR